MGDQTLEKYVTDYMISENESSSNAIKAAEKIMELINNEQGTKYSLLNLIQSMGEYLVHEDDSIRSKATSLFSYAIDHCDPSKLSEQAVTVLVNFYCSRLTDITSVPNLMTGLVALTSKFDQFNSACTKKVLANLVNDVHVQSFAHITRNGAFQVFENLLDYHTEDVKSISDKYIQGFTSSMTGEKDPRNLMTVYTIVQKIVKSLDITHHIDELFDATFCYFPITFRPPPDNPYGITAADLKLNLRKCMASTPLFSKLAIPLLLLKMSTTSGSAKKDALETITACAPVFGASELLPVGVKLYEAVKVEIVNGGPDPSLRDPSLDAIHALTKAMTSHTVDPVRDIEVARVLKPLIKDCISLLDDLDEDSVKPASLMLRSAASASSFAYTFIESTIIPMLLRQYRENDGMKERYLILCTMVAIVQARKIVYGAATGDEEDVAVDHNSVLVSYKDRLIEIFSAAIKASNEHPEVRLMGILGLGLLCVLKRYMPQNERAISIQTLNGVLKVEEEEKLRMPAEVSLIEIATFDPELITQITVPALMDLLPDFASDRKQDNAVPCQLTLNTIQKLCTPPSVYKAAEKDLLKKFIYVCSHNEDKKYAVDIISTLLHLIQAKDSAKHSDLKNSVDTLLPELNHAVITAVLDDTADMKKTIILCHDVMQVKYMITQTIVRNLESNEQQDYVIRMFKLFKEGDLLNYNIPPNHSFRPLSAVAPEAQAACTQIFATVVSALRKDVALPVDSIETFLDEIIGEALKSMNQAQVTSLSRVVASVANKWNEDEPFKIYLKALVERLEGLVQAKSLSALTTYIWVAKALIVRNHRKGLEMTDKIISWIPDSVVGKQSSCAFDVLIGDDPLCLNKQCFATVSFLHKQKFMSYSLPKLLSKFHAANEEDEKLNYLIAVAYLLKNVPRSLLVEELPPLVPLLIESISFPDAVLKLSTLDLFQFALCEATDVIAPHTNTLLPAFISRTRPQEQSMKVRIAALKCLELVSTKISRNLLLPHVKSTLKAIAIPLDDRKRLVRKQAVECRESWYLIGQKE